MTDSTIVIYFAELSRPQVRARFSGGRSTPGWDSALALSCAPGAPSASTTTRLQSAAGPRNEARPPRHAANGKLSFIFLTYMYHIYRIFYTIRLEKKYFLFKYEIRNIPISKYYNCRRLCSIKYLSTRFRSWFLMFSYDKYVVAYSVQIRFNFFFYIFFEDGAIFLKIHICIKFSIRFDWKKIISFSNMKWGIYRFQNIIL